MGTMLPAVERVSTRTDGRLALTTVQPSAAVPRHQPARDCCRSAVGMHVSLVVCHDAIAPPPAP